jgi:2-methylcitrate dehydratase PrpD
MDFEEGGPGLHIAPSLIHTLLAVGQRTGASGAEILATACIVYEINARFHYANRAGDIQRHIPVCLTLAAARLLGLDRETTNLALGLSWNYPVRKSLLMRPPAPKRISRIGFGNLWQCQSGIQSALLAMNGFGELPDELEYREDEYRLEELDSSPEPFLYTADQLQLKMWPASRQCHGALQLLQDLIAEYDLSVDELDRIVLGLPAFYLKPHMFDPSPRTYWEAIYSVQWAAALAILDVEPGPEWFTAERLADPVVRRLAARIEIEEDRESTRIWDSRYLADVINTVTISTRGSIHRRSVTMRDAVGGPGNPMPKGVLDDKFLRQVAPVVGEQRATRLIEALWSIDSVPNVYDLAAFL